MILSAINNYAKAQSLISCNPNQGFPSKSLMVTITGQGTFFLLASPIGASGVYLQQTSTTINSCSFNITSDTTIDADFNLPFTVPLGNYDVHVPTGNQGNLNLVAGFSMVAGTPSSLVSCNPNQGYVGQSLSLTIIGKNTLFKAGCPTGMIGAYLKQTTTTINPVSFSAVDDTTVVANFNIPIAVPLGYYDVHVITDNQGDLKLIGGVLIGLVGINENEINNSIEIYPSPTKNDIHIISKDNNFIPREIKIYDINGKIVFNKNFNNLKNEPLAIDLSNQTSGVYFLNVKTKEGNTITKKFTIDK